jgi:putative transposase
MKLDYPILSLCANLEVSTSGYYDWQKRRTAPGRRMVANQTLAKQIEAIHLQSRQTYGSPRIVEALRKQGCRHGRNRIARLMKAGSLCGRQQGRYRVRTTDSNHDQPIAPQSSGPSSQGHCAQPTLGGGHHLYPNPGRLALPRSHSGPL